MPNASLRMVTRRSRDRASTSTNPSPSSPWMQPSVLGRGRRMPSSPGPRRGRPDGRKARPGARTDVSGPRAFGRARRPAAPRARAAIPHRPAMRSVPAGLRRRARRWGRRVRVTKRRNQISSQSRAQSLWVWSAGRTGARRPAAGRRPGWNQPRSIACPAEHEIVEQRAELCPQPAPDRKLEPLLRTVDGLAGQVALGQLLEEVLLPAPAVA